LVFIAWLLRLYVECTKEEQQPVIRFSMVTGCGMYLRMSLQHAGKFKNEWEDSEEGGWMLLVSRGIRGSRNFIWNERYGNK
jgi:hypothetical protein